MDIYIKMEDAIKACFDGFADCRDDCANNIRRLPAEDVAPIIHGYWIIDSKFTDCIYARCSECDIEQIFYYGKSPTNYCPNCSAKMDRVAKMNEVLE